jgi:uncharacterized protein (TIGR03067 family)
VDRDSDFELRRRGALSSYAASQGPQRGFGYSATGPEWTRTLEGTWQYESMRVGGDPPFGGIKEIANMTLAIKGERYTIKSQEKVLGSLVLKIDPGKSPKIIDFTVFDGPDKGKIVLGIYHLEEHSLKICSSNTGNKRPTEFSSNSVNGHTLITFKRVKS